MNNRNGHSIKVFLQLSDKLSALGDARLSRVTDRAVDGNGWFTRRDILRSADALNTMMLRADALEEWLSGYPSLPVRTPGNVGVIMAGNIPMVGFFDLLCVAMSGHRCFYKPSSKDAVLMRYVAGELHAIDPQLPVFEYSSQPLDAVIATGSDNTKRYFAHRYAGIPAILRGSRTSAAVIAGGETDAMTEGLAVDIFAYSGLGCRNVSHLLLPGGYDVAALASRLAGYGVPGGKYRNNYLQNKAVLEMSGEAFIDGGFFLMRHDEQFPASVSEITYHYYDTADQVRSWLSAHRVEIQCVVGDSAGFARFGTAHYPSLADYPDDCDVMEFLSSCQ